MSALNIILKNLEANTVELDIDEDWPKTLRKARAELADLTSRIAELEQDGKRLEAIAKMLSNRQQFEFQIITEEWTISPDESHPDAIEVQCPNLLKSFRAAIDAAITQQHHHSLPRRDTAHRDCG